jgi:hypothetical protein
LQRAATACYLDALHLAAEHPAEPEVVANLDQSPDLVRSGLTKEPAWPTLRDHQVLLVMKVLGGPDGYNGRPLDEAHAHLDIDRSAAGRCRRRSGH